MIHSKDFERGLLVGMAIMYKKAATAMLIGEFIIVSLAENLLLRTMAVSGTVSVTLPTDTRPEGLAEIVPGPISASDTVSAALG